MVLLVVDTQNAIMNDNLYNFNILKENIEKLISAARGNNVEVIFIRHDDGKESELTKGKTGFEIYDSFRPLKGEKIYDKVYNSAFRCSEFLHYLKSKNEVTIMIVGLQTEYCIDATIKAGFEHGFKMLVPENTNSTFSNRYMSAEKTYFYYNSFIWKNRYAECISLNEALHLIENK